MGMLQEWLNLVVRWAHVLAGILWIGDSFLFMWLDSHLHAPTKPRDGDVAGELWMTHSGGFYEVVKRKSLRKEEMPETLYWFKWESYTTWISGFFLLMVVYWLQGASMMIDPQIMALSQGQAVGISVALLVGAVVVYDVMCRTPLLDHARVFSLVGFGLIVGTAFVLSHVFSGRGAYLHVGAMLGTVMASNVFFRIIPGQKKMIEATKAGIVVDTSQGVRAKNRSRHNHYLTLPVLFTMLSNHFPHTYGNDRPWLVLGLMCLAGVGVKFVMNHRLRHGVLPLAATAACLLVSVWLTMPRASTSIASSVAVSDDTAQQIILTRCTPCHATMPTQPGIAAPPKGLVYESVAQSKQHAAMMLSQVRTKAMPLGNLTQITDSERATLEAWLTQVTSTQ
jgi:uncharacterized membrane protein